MAMKKLGQPVRLSNFALDSNSGSLHAAQTNVPSRVSSFSALVWGGSVDSLKRTAKASSDKILRHSSSDLLILFMELVTDVFYCATFVFGDKKRKLFATSGVGGNVDS